MSEHSPAKPHPHSSWSHLAQASEAALALAPSTFLDRIQAEMSTNRIAEAVCDNQTEPIFDWLMSLVPLQGISDRIAAQYSQQHGSVRYASLLGGIAQCPSCRRLASYWHFVGCGYQKSGPICAEPQQLAACPVPKASLRKGSLNQAAYSLTLFIRDVCDGDFVGWVDTRLAQADPGLGHPDRGPSLRAAVLDPLCEIHGIGPKLWAMILADLLLGADPNRERWVTAGTWMIAVDSLVHNFLHRTGTLARFKVEHAYGSACTAPGGCRDLIEGLARRIDARVYNPSFPAAFPRFVQAALWGFCAEGGWDICNGNRVDDQVGCNQLSCPSYAGCDRRGVWQIS